MKPENTLENKAKFFAQYLWQLVWLSEKSYPTGKTQPLDLECLKDCIKEDYLLLTPLSKISDKDAIEVAKAVLVDHLLQDEIFLMIKGQREKHYEIKAKVIRELYDPKESSGDRFDHWVVYVEFHGVPWKVSIYDDEILFYDDKDEDNCKQFHGLDKLRELGIATSSSGLSVEDLIEYNWIKLEE